MIYFARTPTGSIKIGYSREAAKRIVNLEYAWDTWLAPLATMPGDYRREQEIHKQFRHLRIGRTEQFRPGPDLMEFIGKPPVTHVDPDTIGAFSPSPIDLRNVPIDSGVWYSAKWVAKMRGITLTEYLAELLRPLAQRDSRDELRKTIDQHKKGLDRPAPGRRALRNRITPHVDPLSRSGEIES